MYTITGIGSSNTVEYTECEEDASKVTLPDTVSIDGNTYRVTSVGDKAFYNNKNLKAVAIGSNVSRIDSKAFYGCTNLKQIVVYSKNISSIGSKAFKRVPKSVKVLLTKTKYKSYRKMLMKVGISVKAKFKKIK